MLLAAIRTPQLIARLAEVHTRLKLLLLRPKLPLPAALATQQAHHLLQARNNFSTNMNEDSKGPRDKLKEELEGSGYPPAEDFLPLFGGASSAESPASYDSTNVEVLKNSSRASEKVNSEKSAYPPTGDFLPLSGNVSSPLSPVTQNSSPVIQSRTSITHGTLHDRSPIARDTSPVVDTSPIARDTSPVVCETSPKTEDPAGEKFTYFSKGFTSEVFKIRLRNIPSRMGYNVSGGGTGKKVRNSIAALQHPVLECCNAGPDL